MPSVRILLYSKDKTQRILFSDADDVMATEIEYTFTRMCKTRMLRTGGAQIEVCEKTIQALDTLQAKYDKATKRHIRKLLGFLNGLPDGDFFYFFNEDKTTVVERRTAIDCLKWMKFTNRPFCELINNKIFEHFTAMDLCMQFLSFGFDEIEEWTGESDATKRVCRFCGKSMPDVTFDKVAHSIQEALGNKLLFCYEECDTCNHDLSRVEDQFRVLMDFRRSIFRIPRKGTTKAAKVVGKDFIISPDTNGDPILYLMKEAIPSDMDATKPFKHHAELKAPIINEQMYKALCKMVIDMLPAKELIHFKNTINWIKSTDFMPDSLPSIWLINLPCKKPVYTQPVLDILINNRANRADAPYCTGIIWIYDIAYIFIVPLADIDRGRYKYDSGLTDHWEMMKRWLHIDQWLQQNTTNYKESTPWVDLEVNPCDPKVKILPQSNKIFAECLRQPYELPEVQMPDFDASYLSLVRTPITHYEQFFYGKIHNEDLRDVTLHAGGPIFFIVKEKEQITVKMCLDVFDTTDTTHYYKCDFVVEVHIAHFEEYVSIQHESDETSFAFHYQLRDYLLTFALIVAEKEIQPKRNGTPFHKCSLIKLANMERVASKVRYVVKDAKGTPFCIDDNMIHSCGLSA